MKLLPAEATEYTGGQILWDGRDVIPLSETQMNRLRGRDMAMIFQDPMTSLNPVLTIGNQLCEGIALHQHLGRKACEAKALELLRAVGLTSPEKRLHQYPHELSGGMRQRCLIAMALSCSPRLLFADEPTTALDVTTEAQVLDVLKRLQAELGMAVVLISHNLGVIARCAAAFTSCMPAPSSKRGRPMIFSTARPIPIPRASWHHCRTRPRRIKP